MDREQAEGGVQVCILAGHLLVPGQQETASREGCWQSRGPVIGVLPYCTGAPPGTGRRTPHLAQGSHGVTSTYVGRQLLCLGLYAALLYPHQPILAHKCVWFGPLEVFLKILNQLPTFEVQETSVKIQIETLSSGRYVFSRVSGLLRGKPRI